MVIKDTTAVVSEGWDRTGYLKKIPAISRRVELPWDLHCHMLECVAILLSEVFPPEMLCQQQDTQLFGDDTTFKIFPEKRMRSCLRLMVVLAAKQRFRLFFFPQLLCKDFSSLLVVYLCFLITAL